jgi:hypothetical protein
MNKTTTLGIMALLLVSGALAQTAEISAKHQASLHFMSPPGDTCQVKVNAFSTRTVSGITGYRSDGTTICFVPRQRGGCVPKNSPQASKVPASALCQ